MPHPKGLYPRLESPGGPTSKVSDGLIFDPVLGVREGKSTFLFFQKGQTELPSDKKENPKNKGKIQLRSQIGTL
jgi:hypothetical protein